MDEQKSLELSEKFSQLVIETALKSRGRSEIDALVNRIAAANRDELERIQDSIASLSRRVDGIDSSLQTLRQQAADSANDLRTHHNSTAEFLNRLADDVERACFGASQRSQPVERVVDKSRGTAVTTEVRAGQQSTNGGAKPAAKSRGRQPDDSEVDEESEGGLFDRLSAAFRTTLALATQALIFAFVFGIGVSVGWVANTWKHRDTAVKVPTQDEPFNGAAARSPFDAVADRNDERAKPASPEPEPSPREATGASANRIRKLDAVIMTLMTSVNKENHDLLAKAFGQHGAAVSMESPVLSNLSLQQLEAVTRAGEQGRKVAAFVLQALLTVEGQEVGLDGTLGPESLRALGQVPCVRNASNLKRDPATNNVTDPQAQVVKIVQACTAG